MALIYGGTDITNLGPVSTSNQQSGSSNSSLSGINWDTKLAKGLLPMLLNQGQNVQDVAGGLADNIQGKYSAMMRGAMEPSAFQGVLNQLAQRGVLNSTMGQNTLADAGRGIATGIADKAFDANIAGANAQLQIPGILAQLAQLAQQTKSSGGSYSKSTSSSTNPLAPYQFMESVRQFQPSVQG